MGRGWQGLAAALTAAAFTAASPGFAAAAPFNPAGLSPQQLDRVTDICRGTLGLSSAEPSSTVWGAAVNPGLVGGENHYQGCIAALSASLRAMQNARVALDADLACRGRSPAAGGPDLAECVLARMDATPRLDDQGLVAGPAAPAAAAAIRPFWKVSSGERTRRERLACARLGLDPAGPGFDACVNELRDTFYSIDNPQY